MNDYLLGLLTVPGAAAAFAGIFWLAVSSGRMLKRWWLTPTEFGSQDWEKRARHASCVFAARRVRALKLPGSRLLVFRSTVGGTDYRYGTYFADTNEIQSRASNLLLDEFDPR